MALEITDANFTDMVNKNEGVSVVDFWAPWCGPCKMIGPIIDELHNEYEGKAVIGKVNVDDNPNTSMEFGVRSIPTILVFKNGEIVNKKVGVASKAELQKMIEDAMS
ncbi:MAG: thioredoxin [Saprospiraceae bacterium]|nr:thioredoxin [Saprospiraceae bacterium]